MVRLIGNVLVFGLIAILLSSCAAGVKVLDTYQIEKKRILSSTKIDQLLRDANNEIKNQISDTALTDSTSPSFPN